MIKTWLVLSTVLPRVHALPEEPTLGGAFLLRVSGSVSQWIVVPEIVHNCLGGIVCRGVEGGAPLTGGWGVSLLGR